MERIAELHKAIADPKGYKRNQWDEIKHRDPELAKFLQAVNKTFGKPERVSVKFKEPK